MINNHLLKNYTMINYIIYIMINHKLNLCIMYYVLCIIVYIIYKIYKKIQIYLIIFNFIFN